VACDFVTMPLSRGKRYLLVLIDCFSRYATVYPTSNMSEETVIACFRDFFATFGFPDAVLSDNGAQFCGFQFKSFLSRFHIKKLSTNAYYPQGNGLCERFNGTFKKSLLAEVTENNFSVHDWCRVVNHCLLDYRTSIHSSTKQRPVDLFFSFNARGYITHTTTNTAYTVNTNIQSQLQNKQQKDKRNTDRIFSVGDQVLVKNVGLSKFRVRGDVCTVIRQIDHHTLEVKRVDTGKVFKCSMARVSPIGSEGLSAGGSNVHSEFNSYSESSKITNNAASMSNTVNDITLNTPNPFLYSEETGQHTNDEGNRGIADARNQERIPQDSILSEAGPRRAMQVAGAENAEIPIAELPEAAVSGPAGEDPPTERGIDGGRSLMQQGAAGAIPRGLLGTHPPPTAPRRSGRLSRPPTFHDDR